MQVTLNEANQGDFQLNSNNRKAFADKLNKFALEQRARTCSRLAEEKCGKDGVKGSTCGSTIKPNKPVLDALDAFGRQRLSKHYFMRDFLYSEVAEVHGIANVPDDAELAIKAGRAICRNLLEPLRRVFDHITIRSAFRSANVNGFGNCNNMNCSSNKANYAKHIWDHKDGDGFMGATVCIVIPGFADWMKEQAGRDWQVLAWFIHDYLPYSEMAFFVQDAAVNLTWRGDPFDRAQEGDVRQFDGSCSSIVWRSEPKRRVCSRKKPLGLLMNNGEPSQGRFRSDCYVDFLHHLCSAGSRFGLSDHLQQLCEAKRKEDDRFEGLVEEWRKATPGVDSFNKWRSEQVRKIKDAWLKAGTGPASFAEQENWYRQERMRSSES